MKLLDIFKPGLAYAVERVKAGNAGHFVIGQRVSPVCRLRLHHAGAGFTNEAPLRLGFPDPFAFNALHFVTAPRLIHPCVFDIVETARVVLDDHLRLSVSPGAIPSAWAQYSAKCGSGQQKNHGHAKNV